jgi:hypothetical protein
MSVTALSADTSGASVKHSRASAGRRKRERMSRPPERRASTTRRSGDAESILTLSSHGARGRSAIGRPDRHAAQPNRAATRRLVAPSLARSGGPSRSRPRAGRQAGLSASSAGGEGPGQCAQLGCRFPASGPTTTGVAARRCPAGPYRLSPDRRLSGRVSLPEAERLLSLCTGARSAWQCLHRVASG